jgi:hypothetical protein
VHRVLRRCPTCYRCMIYPLHVAVRHLRCLSYLRRRRRHTCRTFLSGSPNSRNLLEWVDQPPPTQARDTHALHFVLEGMGRTDRLIYAGLMFFHPGSPTAPNFEQQPGFSGIARPLLDTPNCQKLPPLVSPEERPDHQFVQVEVRFRPPQIFATLSFFRLQLPDFPENRCVLRNSTGSTLMSYPTHRL